MATQKKPNTGKGKIKELWRQIKHGVKNGPTKNKVWAGVAFGTCIVLLVYWFIVLGRLF